MSDNIKIVNMENGSEQIIDMEEIMEQLKRLAFDNDDFCVFSKAVLASDIKTEHAYAALLMKFHQMVSAARDLAGVLNKIMTNDGGKYVN